MFASYVRAFALVIFSPHNFSIRAAKQFHIFSPSILWLVLSERYTYVCITLLNPVEWLADVNYKLKLTVECSKIQRERQIEREREREVLDGSKARIKEPNKFLEKRHHKLIVTFLFYEAITKTFLIVLIAYFHYEYMPAPKARNHQAEQMNEKRLAATLTQEEGGGGFM